MNAVGLVLAAATRIGPVAASSLVVVMTLAAMFHISRGEFQALPIDVVLGSLAAFVAWRRLRMAPIARRRS